MTRIAQGPGWVGVPPCHEAACTHPVTGSLALCKEAHFILGQLLLLESSFFE